MAQSTVFDLLFSNGVKFLKGRFLGIGAKIGFSTVLAGISYGVIVLRAAIVLAIIAIIVWIFVSIQNLFDYVDTVNTGSSPNVGFALDVVKSLGLWNAFVDAFNLFSPMLISLLVLKLSIVGLRFLNNIHTIVREHIKIILSHGF
ncbi:hypothetical protein [Sulfurovum sp.]|uniref:hypothetical protein n=1 Tax=Sulfurovum sp. TaxID=1969726 RepID=UPI003569F4E7